MSVPTGLGSIIAIVALVLVLVIAVVGLGSPPAAVGVPLLVLGLIGALALARLT